MGEGGKRVFFTSHTGTRLFVSTFSFQDPVVQTSSALIALSDWNMPNHWHNVLLCLYQFCALPLPLGWMCWSSEVLPPCPNYAISPQSSHCASALSEIPKPLGSCLCVNSTWSKMPFSQLLCFWSQVVSVISMLSWAEIRGFTHAVSPWVVSLGADTTWSHCSTRDLEKSAASS